MGYHNVIGDRIFRTVNAAFLPFDVTYKNACDFDILILWRPTLEDL